MKVSKYLSQIVIVLAILVSTSFVIDFVFTIRLGGADLRTRIVGARYLNLGKNSYLEHTTTETPQELIDPLDPTGAPFNRVTVSPLILSLFAPYSFITYYYHRLGWFFIQWLLLVVSICLFFLKQFFPEEFNKKLLLILSFSFALSPIWRWHVQIGQIYILYTFLALVGYMVFRKSMFWSGFILGFLALLRPPYILFGLIFFIFRRFNFVKGMIISIIVFISLPLIYRITIWQEYINSMNLFGFTQLSYLGGRGYELRVERIKLPEIIEGMKTIGKDWNFETSNSSIQAFIKYYFNISFSPIIMALIFVAIAGLFLFIFYRVNKKKDNTIIYIFSILLVLLADFFIPAPRYLYYDIQWLIPLALLVLVSPQKIYRKKFHILILLIFFQWMTRSYLASYFLAIYTVTWFIIYTQCQLTKNRDVRNSSTIEMPNTKK